MNNENACINCGECKCFSCEYRDVDTSGSYSCCNRCDMGCGDVPVEYCKDFKYSQY